MIPLPRSLTSIDRVHQGVVDVGEEQIGPRRVDAGIDPKVVDQLLDGSGDIHLDIAVEILAEDRQLLAVEHHLDIGETAGARDPDLVGPAERHRPGTGEVELLKIAGDRCERAVEAERYGLLRAHVVRHRLEERPGVTLVGVGVGGRQSRLAATTRPIIPSLSRHSRVTSIPRIIFSSSRLSSPRGSTRLLFMHHCTLTIPRSSSTWMFRLGEILGREELHSVIGRSLAESPTSCSRSCLPGLAGAE